jgi:hypothetical protein
LARCHIAERSPPEPSVNRVEVIVFLVPTRVLAYPQSIRRGEDDAHAQDEERLAITSPKSVDSRCVYHNQR